MTVSKKFSQVRRLRLKANGIIRFAKIEEIIFIRADKNYSHIYLNDETHFIMCRPISYYEKELGTQFFRCHKSYLVNTDYISKLSRKKRTGILLPGGNSIPVSREKYKFLEKTITDNNPKITVGTVFYTVCP